MIISEQIAVAAIFYFGQVLIFCRLINKNVLEWFLLIMCKEHTLSRSTKLINRNHPTLCFCLRRQSQKKNSKNLPLYIKVTVQNPITSFWAVTLLTQESACLERLWTVTSETILKKKQPSVHFCMHELSIVISCLCQQLSGLISIRVYVMFMITNLMDVRMGKLTLNYLIRNSCPEFPNGLWVSDFFKHHSADVSSLKVTLKLSFEPRFRIFIINFYFTKSKHLQSWNSLLLLSNLYLQFVQGITLANKIQQDYAISN